MTLYICKHNISLESIPEKLTQDDAVILIEDGVYQALNTVNVLAKVYVLDEDVQARGIANKIPSTISSINYSGFVKLTEVHQRIITL